MDVRKITCGATLLGMTLIFGCTAPRSQELVLIEPTYSHHRDQPTMTSDEAWSVGAEPFAVRLVEPQFPPSQAGDPSAEAFTWPHTP